MHPTDCDTRRNGLKFPCITYGTDKAIEGNQTDTLHTAIEDGYRCFDTASCYETESSLGVAIARCGLSRKGFFLQQIYLRYVI